SRKPTAPRTLSTALATASLTPFARQSLAATSLSTFPPSSFPSPAPAPTPISIPQAHLPGHCRGVSCDVNVCQRAIGCLWPTRSTCKSTPTTAATATANGRKKDTFKACICASTPLASPPPFGLPCRQLAGEDGWGGGWTVS